MNTWILPQARRDLVNVDTAMSYAKSAKTWREYVNRLDIAFAILGVSS